MIARTGAMLASWWAWWVGLWARREAPHVMALVRIAVAVVLLWDFATVWRLDLITTLWGMPEVGGLGDVLSRKPVPEMYQWLPPTEATAVATFAVMVGALICLAAGFLTPVAAVVTMLVSSQLAQVLPLGDRGIDLMLRNVLLLLAFSGCGRAWSVDAWLFRGGILGRPLMRLLGPSDAVLAWPRYLLVLQILVMYFAAGIQKTSVTWWPLGDYGAIYLILQDPSIAAFRFGWLEQVFPLTQIASAATMVFELGAGAIFFTWWFRDTRTRPGRMRALFNRLELHKWWMVIGVGLHLGIAATMSLGIFPYAMLALYPAFLHPDELPRRAARRVARDEAIAA
ncbi:MAG: HTTM domain-containing protein [Pseudomonadota bacterium]|nr:HTTM domain-containing protein [Pseudomonadota bacterium]